MTRLLFREDPYLKQAEARVTAVTETSGIALDKCLFYPTGGGQPGDCGELLWDGGSCQIETCVKSDAAEAICIPEAGQDAPPIGTVVTQTLDWSRRYAHMRVHTALHLLSVAIPFGVTGGSIGAGKGRLDFDMETPPEDKDAIAAQINEMIARDAAVTEEWISEDALAAHPDLVKTVAVKPPSGAGRIRLIRIGSGENTIDLQPCGGTHVKSLQEIGHVRLGKLEKKGRRNRRVYLHLDV